MPESQAVCPRCRGFRRIGVSPDDPNSRLCDLCGGAGWLDPGQVPRPPSPPELFAPGEAWALTKIGARNIVAGLFWLVVIALPIATVAIVISWWSVANDPLRSILELLPESLVTRSADTHGQPWAMAGVVLVVTAIGAYLLSRARRRALARTIKPRLDAYGLGLARAVVIVGGIGLAGNVGPIADGSDLRREPVVHASPALVGFVVALVLVFALLDTRRLAVKLFLAERPGLALGAATALREQRPPPPNPPAQEWPPPPPAHAPPPPGGPAVQPWTPPPAHAPPPPPGQFPPPPVEPPPTFVDPATGRPVDPSG